MGINVQSYLVCFVISYSSFADLYEGRKSAQVFFSFGEPYNITEALPADSRAIRGGTMQNMKLRRNDREHVRPVRFRYQSLYIFPLIT